MHYYEKSNAREWDVDVDPNSGLSEPRNSDEELIDYVQSRYDVDETLDKDPDSGWQQVSYKKTPLRPSTVPKPSSPMKSSTSRSSPRPKPPPPQIPRPSPTKTPHPPPAQRLRQLQLNLQPLPPRPPPKVTFSTNQDNPAKGAFRAKELPTSFIELNEPCAYIEPDRTRMYEILEEMGVRLGSFIRPPQHLKDKKLLLWGNPSQVERTKHEIQEWIRNAKLEPSESKKSDIFARTGMMSDEKAKAEDKKMKRDSMKQKFQKAPDSSLTFKCIGGFLWPVDEVRPEELLGPSFEAFDPLRMMYQAYITFDHRLGYFDIKSDSEGAVGNVMNRMTGTMMEYAARNRREIMVLMIEFPEPAEMYQEIMTVAAPTPGIGSGTVYMPVLTGPKLPEHEKDNWQMRRTATMEQHFLQLCGITRKVLSYLPYYRGRIQMRVLLGTFALTTFRRWPDGVTSVPFEKFVANTKMSATKGKIIKDLQMKSPAEVLLAAICRANRIFEPVDSLTNKLENTEPHYTALFEFDLPATGKVRLEVELGKPGIDRLYETTNHVWTKLNDKVEAAEPMEAFVVRVQGGLSWELKISTANSVDKTRITPDMTKFVQKIKGRVPPSAKPQISGQRVFTWTNTLPYINFEQKTALRYRMMGNPAWIFEFSRYDTYESSIKGLANTPQNTYWGATFWSSEWDSILSENTNLSIGQSARWNRNLGTFFPTKFKSPFTGPDAGFRDFLSNMKSIVELLDEMKKK